MLKEKSAGAVVFYRNRSGLIEYLVLKHHKKYWNFPKGKIEKGESEVSAAKRETTEETGIRDIKIISNFRISENYYFKSRRKGEIGEVICKQVVFYLAKSKTKKIKISLEHQGYKWLPFERAISCLTYKKSKEILKKANEILFQRESL